jgi:hypothetical protein
MPERSNTEVCCGETRRFLSSLGSAHRNLARDWSGLELYRQLRCEDPDNDRRSGERSRSESEISEEQQKLRWELQGILQRAHEVNCALKQSA